MLKYTMIAVMVAALGIGAVFACGGSDASSASNAENAMMKGSSCSVEKATTTSAAMVQGSACGSSASNASNAELAGNKGSCDYSAKKAAMVKGSACGSKVKSAAMVNESGCCPGENKAASASADVDKCAPVKAAQMVDADAPKVKDVVSGHMVLVADETPHYEFAGNTYYFGCDDCKDQFIADPAKFTSTSQSN
ncbi:hypothetical protein ACFLQV_03095 [Calditrichota bacterium]